VDRLLALALRLYEDGTCSGCGQQVAYSMDPALEDYWVGIEPIRCHACTALAVAQDAVKEREWPHALRHILALQQGWEDARKG
jgi:hypothetical protein